MHGWLYLKPRTTTPPLYDIIYGNMIAAGLEFDRYRKIARVSPLITLLRGWMVLSPRVSNPNVIRTISWTGSQTRNVTNDGISNIQNYSGFNVAIATTTTTRRNRDEGIVFATDPFTIPGIGARPIPNEIAMVKL